MERPREVYYKARNTIIEMFIDRGYKWVDEDQYTALLSQTIEQFQSGGKFDLTGITTPSDKQVYVRFLEDDLPSAIEDFTSLVIAPIRDKFSTSKDATIETIAKTYKIIVVYTHMHKKQTFRPIPSTNEDKWQGIECHEVHTISFNRTKHVLVPKHILLSKEEKLELFRSYPKETLPRISSNDAIVRWFDAQPGDVFKIIDTPRLNYRIVSAAADPKLSEMRG
jgi:DNA-directed RNA polymerase subunit H (RpoH/RPB5)